jgi:predicted metal-dependent hydrolase
MPGRPLIGDRVPDRDRNFEGKAENARPRDSFGRPLPYGAVDQLNERVEPARVVSGVRDALERAAALFDRGRFFEAHEFLEWIWKSDEVASADRDYWKGVTQVAVGCAHTQRGNATGAVTLLDRAQRYMTPYPSPYQGIDRDVLALGARTVINQIATVGAGPDLEFPRFPLSTG